jgi:predicted secreted protein
MSFKKTLLVVLLTLFMCVSTLWAGDSAVFVDLGFSPDGRTYMFGQHGVLSPSLRPWADLFIVDMNNNNFVPNGRISFTQDTPIRAGQDGSGVFFRLLADNSNLINRHRINFQNQGLPLFISRNENPSPRGETIDFRDFISGNSFRAQLIPTITGSGQNVRSSFYIDLEMRLSNGRVRHYTVGSPNFVRQQVASYNIKKVLVDSSGDSIIFVIEMRRPAASGYDIRYMVEAQRL